jgi:Methyltransferase FkbM domain
MVNFCPFLDYLAEVTAVNEFLLVDIGCAGGIDRRWLRLGRRLHAIGFDANAAEIETLAARESSANVTYLNALAAIAPDHPFARKKEGQPDCQRNTWPRTSAKQYVDLVHPEQAPTAHTEACASEPGRAAMPVSKEPVPVVVPEYLQQTGVKSLDFLKIDVDGKDFDVLNSFDRALSALAVLGVGVEVNFFGSDCETDNTFHNMDHFLKARGFELLTLSTRRYSVGALPSRFLGGAGPTETGRILQGDAMYARDLASGLYDDFANSLAADKLLNLMAILAIFNLPDCAAELALKFRTTLSRTFDVDRMLDLLAAQQEGAISGEAGYRQHLSRFAQNPNGFLGTKNPALQLGRALKKGYLKWRGARQLARLERARK